ncbi:hypothetical protein CAEBREN_08445 [Caenorhabditis brenneri]|uniref:Uncharacterized protein n=1 Tax=Caenorhabditis brenneri TaxID=135651 RepID=G0NTY5_CAEBE|nr:hypothetical protein CAEBREN_08445 [Caenorhabditis brenneri]
MIRDREETGIFMQKMRQESSDDPFVSLFIGLLYVPLIDLTDHQMFIIQKYKELP